MSLTRFESDQTNVSPLDASLQAFSTKVVFPPDYSELRAASDFRVACLVAIAHEDDALLRSRGGDGLIFWHPTTATTPLHEARAGAAVFYEALIRYCAEKQIEPQLFLEVQGTTRTDANMYLEYSSAIYNALMDLEKANEPQ